MTLGAETFANRKAVLSHRPLREFRCRRGRSNIKGERDRGRKKKKQSNNLPAEEDAHIRLSLLSSPASAATPRDDFDPHPFVSKRTQTDLLLAVYTRDDASFPLRAHLAEEDYSTASNVIWHTLPIRRQSRLRYRPLDKALESLRVGRMGFPHDFSRRMTTTPRKWMEPKRTIRQMWYY